METIEYHITQDLRIPDIKAALKANLPLTAKAPKTLVKHFLDSDDWRLFQKNWVLTVVDQGTTHLELRRLHKRKIKNDLDMDTQPRFVADMPSSNWQQQLAPVLDVRALISKAEVHVRQHPIMLEEPEQTRLFASIEESRLRLANGRYRALGRRLKIYCHNRKNRRVKKACKIVEKNLQLTLAEDEPLLTALHALAVIPGEYRGKPRYAIDATQRSDLATKQILLELFEIMEHNEAGILDDIDTEFLHDFRVSVRRTRSALGQIKGVFPRAVTDDFRRRFAWLNSVTGDGRDLDVYLLEFEQFTRRLPLTQRPDLEPLRTHIELQRDQAYHNIAKALKSQRYLALKRGWRTFLTAAAPRHTPLANAKQPVNATASQCIWKAYRRIIKQGHAIAPNSPAEDIHELRKSCKKLRYLLEFFQTCYSRKKTTKLIKTLKTLQDYLGHFQDLHVQREHLQLFELDMAQRNPLTPDTQAAIDTLRQLLHDAQNVSRRQFDEHFSTFTQPSNHRCYQQLFKPH